ncbi:hypothetical protein LNTAR_23429 [Lentisphaera araneosa HTCC2155]|uniref:Uncharacterized protein n=1 Tax=Lentisphaera araneosa HTCC2155 TaxID=313628 RepID=A6DGS7_9BACT|nr:hypothetical protein LNTAR_23429 [Lentisphaera araneosa HTCC2155]
MIRTPYFVEKRHEHKSEKLEKSRKDFHLAQFYDLAEKMNSR